MASNNKTNTTSITPMWLKIIVDVKANKVVFAEADQDFVDFIFHLMTLPLASICKLLYIYDDYDTVASCNVGALYKSIHALHTDCFPSNLNKDSLLSPKISIALPLFSFFDIPKVGLKLNACTWCNRYSDCAVTLCSNCKCTMKSLTAYVRGGAAYVVTDNMEVKPMSVSFVKSLVKDLDQLEEQHVEVGPTEVITLNVIAIIVLFEFFILLSTISC